MIGHEWQRKFLEQAWVTDCLAHAYFLAGPEGIGKKSVVQEFSKLILCSKPDKRNFKNCKICQSCSLNIDKHPDFFVLGLDGKEIKINNVRVIKKQLRLKPAIAGVRVVLIDNAHLLNKEASNSLLKLIEEPKGDIYFFLVSHQLQKVLPTILSRTQIVRFQLIPKVKIEELVRKQNWQVPAELLVWFSQGRPAWIYAWDRWFGDSKNKDKFKELIQVIDGFNVFNWFDWSTMIENQESDVNFELLSQIIVHGLLSKLNGSLSVSIDKYIHFQRKLLGDKFIKWISNLMDVGYLSRTTNVNVRLAWENIFWRL